MASTADVPSGWAVARAIRSGYRSLISNRSTSATNAGVPFVRSRTFSRAARRSRARVALRLRGGSPPRRGSVTGEPSPVAFAWKARSLDGRSSFPAPVSGSRRRGSRLGSSSEGVAGSSMIFANRSEVWAARDRQMMSRPAFVEAASGTDLQVVRQAIIPVLGRGDAQGLQTPTDRPRDTRGRAPPNRPPGGGLPSTRAMASSRRTADDSAARSPGRPSPGRASVRDRLGSRRLSGRPGLPFAAELQVIRSLSGELAQEPQGPGAEPRVRVLAEHRRQRGLGLHPEFHGGPSTPDSALPDSGSCSASIAPLDRRHVELRHGVFRPRGSHPEDPSLVGVAHTVAADARDRTNRRRSGSHPGRRRRRSGGTTCRGSLRVWSRSRPSNPRPASFTGYARTTFGPASVWITWLRKTSGSKLPS